MRPYYETWWFEWLFILVCCATGFFLWQMADHPFLETGQENASFVELAKSLVEGKGYTLLHTAEDAPYIQSPPVYPLMLAGLMTFAHQTDVIKMIHPFKVLNLALYLLSIVLVYSYFQKYIRKPYPFVVTALYAFAPMTLSVAGSITSEMAYMVFSMMAILAIDKYFPEKGVEVSKWQLFLCIFWVVASVLTRNIGFALLLAFFFIAFRTVGMKQAFLILAVCLVCLAPWFLREVYYKNYFPNQLAASGQNASLGLSSGGLSSGGSSATSNPNNASGLTSPLSWSDPALYFRQVVLNGEATLSDTTQNTLGVLNFDRFDSLVVNKLRLQEYEMKFSDYGWIRWTLGGIIALGLFLGMRQASGIGSYYLAAFILAGCFVLVEKQSRYLLPVLPFILFYLYFGVMRFGEWMAQLKLPVSKIVVPLLTLLIGFNSLNGHLEHIKEARLIQAYYRPDTDTSERVRTEQKGYLRALQWIRVNTPPNVEIVARKPSAAYIYTDRKARMVPPRRNMNALINDLKLSDYILEEKMVQSVQRFLSPAIEAHPELFKLVYNDPASEIRVWQISRSAGL